MHTQVFTHTVQATGAGVQRRFVNFAGAQAIAADEVLGVAKTDFQSGQDFAVDILGVVAVEAGGAVNKGQPIIPDAQGRGVADGGNATNRVGRALNTVTAIGQTLFILIK
jgi:Uncharacterized conserved protein (DUF2190)